jgi:hypothetical protein
MTNAARYTDGMNPQELASALIEQIDMRPAAEAQQIRAALQAHLALPPESRIPESKVPDSAGERINTGSRSTEPAR